MNRTRQYGLVVLLIGGAAVLSYVGFVLTGGAIPWGERFGAVMDGELGSTGGPIFQFGRGGIGGFLLASPLRDNVIQFGLILLLLVGSSVGLYWWVSRSE